MADGSAPNSSRRAFLVGTASAVAVAGAAGLHRAVIAHGRQTVVSPGAVTWISTTSTSPWQVRPLRTPGTPWDVVELEVDLAQTFQTVEGFGACFNELGWTSLQQLRPADQESIFRELFAPGVGANFTLCRMPVGANDFSRDWYSYDETAGDLALEHFSIDNDLQTLVPFIKAAQRFNPGLRLWASPWSPPSWMKKNGFYAEAEPGPGQPGNGILPGQVGKEGTDMFLQEDRYFEAYAHYFGRFIDAYRQQGIPIGMVMPQNEFNSAQIFPSCTWTPEGLARFVEHLGPVMAQRGVQIFFGTLERGNPELLNTFLSDAAAAKYVTGVGVQWAGKGALPAIHQQHPGLKLYQSEQECGDGKNDWKYCTYCWKLMKLYFENGANAYMYWNLSLLKGGISHWGWKQNSLVTVDAGDHTFQFNSEFYLLKHASHFVQPGAQRVGIRGLLHDALAFHNPDGSVVVLLRNDLPFGRPVDLVVGDRRIEGWLEADSINTVLLQSEAAAQA